VWESLVDKVLTSSITMLLQPGRWYCGDKATNSFFKCLYETSLRKGEIEE